MTAKTVKEPAEQCKNLEVTEEVIDQLLNMDSFKMFNSFIGKMKEHF
jgi:hypothetical protein